MMCQYDGVGWDGWACMWCSVEMLALLDADDAGNTGNYRWHGVENHWFPCGRCLCVCVMMLEPAVPSHPPTTKWFPRSAVPV